MYGPCENGPNYYIRNKGKNESVWEGLKTIFCWKRNWTLALLFRKSDACGRKSKHESGDSLNGVKNCSFSGNLEWPATVGQKWKEQRPAIGGRIIFSHCLKVAVSHIKKWRTMCKRASGLIHKVVFPSREMSIFSLEWVVLLKRFPSYYKGPNSKCFLFCLACKTTNKFIKKIPPPHRMAVIISQGISILIPFDFVSSSLQFLPSISPYPPSSKRGLHYSTLSPSSSSTNTQRACFLMQLTSCWERKRGREGEKRARKENNAY